MGFFPPIKKRIAPPASTYTLSTAYQRISFAVPRLAHIESMELRIGVKIGTGAAAAVACTADNVLYTKLMDGLANIVSKISFTAGSYAYVNAVSGASVLRYAANVDVLDDATELAIDQPTTADIALTQIPLRGYQAAILMESPLSHVITYPLYFGHPQLAEPNNAALMVPMPRFATDGILDVDIGKIAEIGTLQSAGTTVCIISPMLVVNYRVLPDSVPHFRHSLNESQVSITATGETEFKLESTGTYTGLLATFLNNSYVETDPCASGGTMKFGIGASIPLEFTPQEMMIENGRSKLSGRSLFKTATVYLDFLTQGIGGTIGLNTALNANPSTIGSNQYFLKTNIDTLSTSVIARYLTHRIEGDLKSLKVIA